MDRPRVVEGHDARCDPRGGLDLWRRWRGRVEERDYYGLAAWQRATVAVVYLGLAGVLALAMSATHLERSF